MTGTIFDLINEPISEGKQGYFDIAAKAPQPKDKSFLNDIKDYGKTILKGGIEGITRLGRIMGPLDEGKTSPETFEQQTETLEEILPTDEGFVQKGLRRGLREAPSMMAFPGSPIQSGARTIAGGFAGEGAKELGAPEWLQTAAEITTQIGPDITKKLLEKGNNKDLIAEARKLGLTDEQITPLIQSENKQKWLSKLVSRRGSTEKALGETKKGLSQTYSFLQQSPEAALQLTQKSQEKLMRSMGDKLFNMPSEVRNKIKTDLHDLLRGPLTGESLINFYTDVNHYLGQNTKQLSLLKEPIKEALTEISPKLGKDFDLINQLYSKYYPIANRLKPNLTSDIINAAEALGIGGSVLFGNYPTLFGILGEKLAKKTAQQMLINPHFQQLSQKMVVAINQNKFGIAKKVIEDLRNEISKFSPEAASKINDLSKEDFEEFIKSHSSKNIK